jgi:hypothetical protein
MIKQKLKHEYRDLKFKSDNEFKEWLLSKTKKIIEFVDEGQDCLRWYIDEGGEVLHSLYQAWCWNGGIVKLNSLRRNKEIRMINEDGETFSYDFIVENIISTNEKIKEHIKNNKI